MNTQSPQCLLGRLPAVGLQTGAKMRVHNVCLRSSPPSPSHATTALTFPPTPPSTAQPSRTGITSHSPAALHASAFNTRPPRPPFSPCPPLPIRRFTSSADPHSKIVTNTFQTLHVIHMHRYFIHRPQTRAGEGPVAFWEHFAFSSTTLHLFPFQTSKCAR